MTTHQEGSPETAPEETTKNKALVQMELGLLVDDEVENGSRMALRAHDRTQIEVENGWLGKFTGSLPRGVAYFFIASAASLLFFQSGYEGESTYRYVVTFFSFGLAAQIVDIVSRQGQTPQ